jgi:hypothetical protein
VEKRTDERGETEEVGRTREERRETDGGAAGRSFERAVGGVKSRDVV